jgi:argininosuccinate lyase
MGKMKQEMSEKVNNKVFDQYKKDLKAEKTKIDETNKAMIARLEHMEKKRSLKEQELQQIVYALQKCISEIQHKETSHSYYSLWQKSS